MFSRVDMLIPLGVILALLIGRGDALALRAPVRPRVGIVAMNEAPAAKKQLDISKVVGPVSKIAKSVAAKVTKIPSNLPAEVIDCFESRFSPLDQPRAVSTAQGRGSTLRTITTAEVAALWGALVEAYGGEALALLAARQNPTVLHPLYTSPPSVIERSKAALVDALGGDSEAAEVMLMNPAVLQCGEPLATQPAEQIRAFARARQMLDSVPPAASKTMLGGVAALLLLNFALLSDDAAPGIAALSAVLKPALGFIGSVGFIGCIGLSLKVQSDGPQSRETTVNML